MDLLPEIDLSWRLVSPKQKGLLLPCWPVKPALFWNPGRGFFVSMNAPTRVFKRAIYTLPYNLFSGVWAPPACERVGTGDCGRWRWWKWHQTPDHDCWFALLAGMQPTGRPRTRLKAYRIRTWPSASLEYGKCASSEIRDSMILSSEKIEFSHRGNGDLLTDLNKGITE